MYALYAVALGIGLRRGEALGLAWSDLDLDVGVLRVRQALYRADGRLQLLPPKTARSRRTVPLPPICVEALKEHQRHQQQERTLAGHRWQDSALVFTTEIGTPIDPSNLSRWFRELCQRAGLRRVRLHDLRHTCASLL
jgi:integrase